jgi:ubiquinone/menaquinone biosynthesis C-methylase UbiE
MPEIQRGVSNAHIVSTDLTRLGKQAKYTPAGEAAFGVYPKEIEATVDYDKMWANAVSERVGKGNRAHILDVGCGNGRRTAALIQELIQKGHPVTAHLRDIQQSELAEAERFIKEKIEADDLVIATKQEDASMIALPDDSIEGVIAQSVLPWIDAKNTSQAVRQIRRILKKDGVSLISVMTPFNRVGIYNTVDVPEADMARRDEILNDISAEGAERDSAYIVHNTKYGKDISLFTMKAITKLILDSGLKIEQIEAFRNPQFSNGFGDEFPENIRLIARK